jgi:hypothetical protein
MSTTAGKTTGMSNYSREEFEEVIAAMDSIVEMDLPDLDETHL